MVDYTEKYGSIMQFGKNKKVYIHRWYPFVEGYSKEFIQKIIDEYKKRYKCEDITCLEPFAGSGTTPLELQRMGYRCYSFEVSPFMYDLGCSKLDVSYTVHTFDKYYTQMFDGLKREHDYEEVLILSQFKTLVEHDGIDKWILNREVRLGILDILSEISAFTSNRYRRLYKVALASILLEVSNVYRNGKCVSYKKNWNENIRYSRQDVHKIYLNRLKEIFRVDIMRMQKEKKQKKIVSNMDICFCGDSRKLIFEKISNNSIDLVITSPPYLNSRDYTDTYMVELKVLGYMSSLTELKNLREKTLRSHVQIKWGELETLNITELENVIDKIAEYKDKFWNDDLLNMIKGYFSDIDTLFRGLKQKMSQKGMIFFNVANSSYYNVEVKVDEIVCKIAEKNGFIVEEIREARRINTSSQQKEIVNGLRESVIVIKNDFKG